MTVSQEDIFTQAAAALEAAAKEAMRNAEHAAQTHGVGSVESHYRQGRHDAAVEAYYTLEKLYDAAVKAEKGKKAGA